MANTVELYGCKGCGSAVVEALLAWAGVPYTYHEVEPWKPGPAVDALARINPLVQVPTLVLEDGAVVTESAAMIIALDELHREAGLLPPIGDPARWQALRWILFIAGNMYPAISVGDFPERWTQEEAARKALADGARERLQHYWTVMEQAITPAPYLAGSDITALDLYAAMLSYWRPGRKWVNEHCPRIAGVLARAEQHPAVTEVWKRNFNA
ncbi:MAG TPA: glutathione S-transferase family protein [Casimicrobiaceae bacterium]|nr:glutathione S-transferase family protein [Casimicrobiaceae bacterium]